MLINDLRLTAWIDEWMKGKGGSKRGSHKMT